MHWRFGGREPAHRAQSERQLRWRRQCRMTTQEQQRERVVARRRRVVTWRRCQRRIRRPAIRQIDLTPFGRRYAAQFVGQALASDGDQPSARVAGHALHPPLLRGRDERLLHGIFCRIERATAAQQRTEGLGRELAQQVLDRRRSTIRCGSHVRHAHTSGLPS